MMTATQGLQHNETRAGPIPPVDALPLTAWQQAAMVTDAGRTSGVRIVFAARPDRPALGRAVAGLVGRHPTVRSTIDLTPAGGPVQVIHAPAPVDLLESGGSGRSLAPATPGAPRCSVSRMPDGRIAITLVVDGPLLDGPSAALIAGELLRRYLAELDGRPMVLDVSTSGMHDVVAAERRGVTALATAFWRHTLGVMSPSPAPGVLGAASGPFTPEAVMELPAGVASALRQRAVVLRIPLDALLLAAHLRVLGVLTGTARVTSWLLDDVRELAGVGPDAVGDFRGLRPISLRWDVPTWAALIGQVVAALEASRPYRLFPVAELADVTRFPGVIFGHRTVPPTAHVPADPRLGAVECTVIDPAAAPLTFGVESAGSAGGLTLRLTQHGGNPEELLNSYRRALVAIAADPGQDPRPAARLLNLPGFGDVTSSEPLACPAPRSATLHGLVAAQVARTPDAPAVIDGGVAVSYAELQRRTAALSSRLRAIGVGPGSTVGVHLPRGADLVVALLAVLTAGAAFLPLDVDYPRQRNELALADCAADVMLTRSDVVDRLSVAGSVLVIDSPGGEQARVDAALPVAVPPGALAYLLYTSGSTGRPKGVAVPHSAAVNQMRWLAGALPLRPDDRVAQRTPVAFDAALWELFAPLTCGAAVVTVPVEASREVTALEGVLQEQEVTVLQTVPSVLGVLVEEAVLRRCPALSLLCCGGEVLPRSLAEAVAAQTDARLLNLYGPAENCIHTTWWRAGSGAVGNTVPIGRPVAGVRLHVLDEAGEPVLPGALGELYVGGVQLAWGYWGSGGATAERFVPDHLSGLPGERLYRTGDRVRCRPGGELEFLSRTDDQVKVRGVRTELGEVEAVLAGHARVRQVAVVARQSGIGSATDLTLVAYLVWDGGDTGPVASAVGELRNHLRARLPEAMVPTAFVPVQQLPLLPNGKIDRRRLPAPGGLTGGYRPPADPVEQWLAARWAQLLGVDAVGRHDDVVAMGVRPLQALRFAALVSRKFGRTVSAAQVLRHATVADLAAALGPGADHAASHPS